MPNVDKHPPGAFCWIELASSDPGAAKHFYSSLFGWVPNDMPVGPDEVYTIFRLDGRDAAAGYKAKPEEPTHWGLYIASSNADETANRAAELGGKALSKPFDVFDAGRMAILQDPTGAVFCAWQANKNTGIGIAGVEGTLCWADLSTPDPQLAKQFYAGLFGWAIEPGENDASGYLHIKNGETFIGGVQPAENRDPNAPPHWLPYFLVADADASAAKALELGGKQYVAPMTLEKVGRFAVLGDPQGAVFAIFKAEG